MKVLRFLPVRRRPRVRQFGNQRAHAYMRNALKTLPIAATSADSWIKDQILEQSTNIKFSYMLGSATAFILTVESH